MTQPAPESIVALPAHEHAHTVQFYEDESFLCAVVGEHVAEALAAGRGAIVVATEAHREALADELATRGAEVARARLGGQLAMLDARETLDRIMADGRPDAERFDSVIGGAIRQALESCASVCAYGEMVDLLWKDGNAEGAIELEQLWNELAATLPFTLLCGYALDNFDDVEDARAFGRVCALHDHVLPTERYLRLDEPDRLREVGMLQQRARALETEMAYRRRLERRLRTALAEAESASRAKTTFLATMSHELRTPLNAIAGYVELLEMGLHGPVSEQQRETLGRVQRSQRHLLGLINEVLTYARVEAGQLHYAIVEVPADDVLRSAEEVILPQMQAKRIDYAYRGCDPAVMVRGDVDKVCQIVLNLLGNAMKYTDSGGRVWMECEVVGDQVRVHVHDTGRGIPAEKLETVFQPFVQGDGNFTRAQDGVGLGLAISRSLALGMQGSIQVRSAPGQGSTFTLVLPRA